MVAAIRIRKLRLPSSVNEHYEVNKVVVQPIFIVQKHPRVLKHHTVTKIYQSGKVEEGQVR